MLITLLFIFWIILNGNISVEIVLFGIGICIAVQRFTYKNTRLTRTLEKRAARKLLLIIEYLFILVIEVLKANIDIIKLVLSPNSEIKPTLKYITTDLKSRAGRVALANSITLTPGTITVTMNDDELLIHAIHESNLDGMEESIFVQKLRRLEE